MFRCIFHTLNRFVSVQMLGEFMHAEITGHGLTSSEVSRGCQVSKIVQADDINDGTDNPSVILRGCRKSQ